MRKGQISTFETNILYLIVGVLLLTVGAFLQSISIRSGLLITEYVLILLPVIIYLKIKDVSIKETLKLKKLKFKHGLMVIGITILNYPIALFFNLIIMTIISRFSDIQQLPIPTATNFNEYIGLFFIIAISAGICEEVFFRGLLLSSYENEFGKSAIVITAIMFGVFHFNPQNLLAPIILGVIFGYLVQVTGSIYAGIIGHIANNGIAVTLAYGINLLNQRISELTNVTEVEVSQSITTKQLFAATMIIGLIAVICGIFVALLIKAMKKDFLAKAIENISYNDEIIGEDHSIILEKRNTSLKRPLLNFAPVMVVFLIYIVVVYLQLR